jgi:hypothetical protein
LSIHSQNLPAISCPLNFTYTKDVSCEVNADEEEQDLFQVLFKPFESGMYFVYVKFNGQEIAGKF